MCIFSARPNGFLLQNYATFYASLFLVLGSVLKIAWLSLVVAKPVMAEAIDDCIAKKFKNMVGFIGRHWKIGCETARIVEDAESKRNTTQRSY